MFQSEKPQFYLFIYFYMRAAYGSVFLVSQSGSDHSKCCSTQTLHLL